MIDRDVVTEKIGYIEKNLDLLRSLRELPEQSFLQDHYAGAAKYYLQTCIEAILDINHHIIARLRLGVPKNYADSFRILGEKGILPEQSLQVFYEMTRFRNRIVHLYQQVDEKELYKILQTGLDDFNIYIKAITGHFFR
ncbi:MAG: DUF86 domain-containing protein [Peptococcaceae bacterium]|nr:DUF86 domain-containing protein [Peptococcaceae bacterium]